jgi:hypothetical protein
MRKLYKLTNTKNTIINFGYLADMLRTRSYLNNSKFRIEELTRSEALRLWRSYRDALRNGSNCQEIFTILDDFINN